MNPEQMIDGDVPRTGDVRLIRSIAVEFFKANDCQIVQHGGKFRLHAEGMALSLDADDALYMIDKLSMGAELTGIMRRVVVWKCETTKVTE